MKLETPDDLKKLAALVARNPRLLCQRERSRYNRRHARDGDVEMAAARAIFTETHSFSVGRKKVTPEQAREYGQKAAAAQKASKIAASYTAASTAQRTTRDSKYARRKNAK